MLHAPLLTPFAAFHLLVPFAAAEDTVAPAAPQATPVDARFALALYCNPTCDEKVFDSLEQDLSAIPAVEGFDATVTAPGRMMGLTETTASATGADSGFAAPDAAFIEQYGVNVDRADLLAESESVILVWFASPRDQAVATLATAHTAFVNAAKVANGWVEDLDTQSLYGQDSWAAKDPNGPLTDWFVVEDNNPTTSDAPAPADLRLVTRGLRRFGDRELVLDHVPADGSGDAACVLDAVAVALHARADVPTSLDVATAQARGTAALAEAPTLDDDPEGPLLSVAFKGQLLADAELGVATAAPAEAPPAETTDALAAVPAPVARDAEHAPVAPADATPVAPPPSAHAAVASTPASLAEAQAAMRARLSTVVHDALTSGLPPGDAVAVSVPYPNADGTREYLWVEVHKWQGSVLTGVVVTQPSKTKSVQRGQSVNVEQGQIFDYVWKHADGTREGNTTAPFVH